MANYIFIIEDNSMIQELLCKLLNRLPNLKVCGTARTAWEALAQLPESGADLVLVDVSLPGISGIEFIAELQLHHPEFPCLMLSGYREPGYACAALAAGARGYVVKGAFYELMEAIQHVLDGQLYLSRQLKSELANFGQYAK